MFFWKATLALCTTLGLMYGATTHPSSEDVIVIQDEDGVWSLNINDEAFDIDTDNLAVGDSQTLSLEDGRELTISRTESGLSIELDGEQIDIRGEPKFLVTGTHGDLTTRVLAVGKESKRVKVVTGIGDEGEHAYVFRTDGHAGSVFFDSNEVVINGLGDLDEEARTQIENLLQELGVTKEIRFSPNLEWVRDVDIDVRTTEEGDKPRVIVIEKKKN